MQTWKFDKSTLKRMDIVDIYQELSSVAQLHLTFCDPMDRSTPGFPVYHQLPEFIQTHVHGVSDTIQPCHPLSSLCLSPSILPSIRVFWSESALRNRGPKYWSFSFSISPSNEYSALIAFRIDWFDLADDHMGLNCNMGKLNSTIY